MQNVPTRENSETLQIWKGIKQIKNVEKATLLNDKIPSKVIMKINHQKRNHKCFSYYIGNCWVCIDTVWVGLKFTRKLCFRVNVVLPMLYLYIPNHFQYSKSHVPWSFDFPLLKVWWWNALTPPMWYVQISSHFQLSESRMTMVHEQ